MPLACTAFRGFGTHAPGTTIQSVISRWHLRRETCTNGHGITTSMILLIIFGFGEFSSPETIMTLVPMTACIPRSQIIAFNVQLRLPSHATKVGIHVATALKDSQVAQRKEFWSGAPRTCTCIMVGIPDIARKERSFRD